MTPCSGAGDIYPGSENFIILDPKYIYLFLAADRFRRLVVAQFLKDNRRRILKTM
jgi:hypothetical protein